MKKTAQEIHNEQIEGLSNGMSISDARKLAELKDQAIKEETVFIGRSLWPRTAIIAALIVMVVFAIVGSIQALKSIANEPTEQMRQRAKHNNNFIP